MAKVRTLLLGLITVLSVGGYALWAQWSSMGNRDLMAFAALYFLFAFFLVFSATVLLFSTFFRIRVASDGSLRYDQRHPLWVLLRKAYGGIYEINDVSAISLCAAFWLVFFASFFSAFLSVMIVGPLVATVVQAMTVGLDFTYAAEEFAAVGVAIGEMLLILCGVVLLSKGFKGKRWVLILPGVIMFFAAFVVMPIALIMYIEGGALGNALLLYYEVAWAVAMVLVGIAIISIVSSVGAFALMSLAVSLFKDTVFAQYLVALKKRMCPLLYAETLPETSVAHTN